MKLYTIVMLGLLACTSAAQQLKGMRPARDENQTPRRVLKGGKKGGREDGGALRGTTPSTAGFVASYNANSASNTNAGQAAGSTSSTSSTGTGTGTDTAPNAPAEANVSPDPRNIDVVVNYGDTNPGDVSWVLFDLTGDRLVLWSGYDQVTTPGTVVATRAERMMPGDYRLVVTNRSLQGLGTSGWVKVVDSTGVPEGGTSLEFDDTDAVFRYKDSFGSLVIKEFTLV